MNHYDAIDAQLRSIRLPEDRGLAQRWFLHFLADNPRFTAIQAAEIASQVGSRWGTDLMQESFGEDWITRPLPATRAEWESDGYRVPREARPLLITGENGRQVELFLLFDVELVHEDLVGTVDHDIRREPAPPAEGASDLAEFALHMGKRERHAFSHLWKVGALLRWADVPVDAPAPERGALGWIEVAQQQDTCRPEPGMRIEDACCCLVIHPDAEGTEVVGQALSLIAQLLLALMQGRRAGERLCVNGEAHVSDLEIGIVSWVVGRRLGFGSHHANVDAFRFIEHLSEVPAPDDVNWGYITETIGVMEELLCGEGHPDLHVPPRPRPAIDDVPGLVSDPFEVVDRELAMRKADTDGEAAERWMLEFVAANPRFSVPTALALGWQLYRRWGSAIAGDDSRSEWAGTVDIRSVEEWSVRGRVPKPQAVLLVAPGTHGQDVYYLLRDDSLVANRLAALQSSVDEGCDHSLPVREAPHDAPALDEFDGLVTPREKEILRNLWRGEMIPVIVDSEEDKTRLSAHRLAPPHQLPVIVQEGVNPMHDIIEHLANWVLAWELGVLHTAPVVGLRFWAATEWESALVSHLVTRRLDLGDEERFPLVEQALSREETVPGLIRWGLVYHAASRVENLLLGFPS